MTTTIESLLSRAAVPTTSPAEFDVGAALRRLATESAQGTPTPEMMRAARAGQRLAVVSRWIINGPGAAAYVEHLAQDRPAQPVEEAQMDMEGALVYACLLSLTGHPESAQFWWQLSAGAGNRIAAFCLHLHHLALGEAREAQHWRHEIIDALPDTEADVDDQPDDLFLTMVEVVAHYVRRTGSTASAPTGGLEMEVGRLAQDKTESSVIVRRPDRQLADHLAHFTRR